MLTPVGETVILVEVAGAGDYANCSAVLDAETLKVLAKGWAFNSEKEVELMPDADGRIAVAPNTLQIDPSDPREDYVQRGAFLYNKNKKTDVFTKPVKCDVVKAFTFEECPYMVQRIIVAQAAKVYQRSYVGSTQLDAFASEERLEAGADALDAESDVDDYNILDNPDLHYLNRRTYRPGM
jgi:Tail tubular protein